MYVHHITSEKHTCIQTINNRTSTEKKCAYTHTTYTHTPHIHTPPHIHTHHIYTHRHKATQSHTQKQLLPAVSTIVKLLIITLVQSMSVPVCVCVYLCVCVCVCAHTVIWLLRLQGVCVCVCVCVSALTREDMAYSVVSVAR